MFIAIIPTHLLCQMWANPPEAEFQVPYPSSEREIKFRRCLFTSSIKREIRHVHVVVVQKRERNVQKKCDARAKLLFCLLNLLFFLPSRCRPRRWILKSLLFFYRYLAEMGNAMYSFFTSNSISFVTQEALKYTVLNGMKRYWCFSLSMTIK